MAETLVELIQEGKDITECLSDFEIRSLEEFEAVIKAGFNTFLDVGKALSEIRDNRLYRGTHKTFEKYCKDVWDLSKGYATRQIAGYETVTLLENKMVPIGTISNLDKKIPAQQETILPINESQTRPLTLLKDPDDQVRAWGLVLDQLTEGKKLTASLIKNVVKEVKGEVAGKKVKKVKKKIDGSVLVSNLFKRQYQVMLDILAEERNSGWQNTSKKEAVKWLKTLVSIAESED